MPKKTTALTSPVDVAIEALKKIQTRIRQNKLDLIQIRFDQGTAVKDIVGSAEYGEGEVKKIAEAVGEFPTTIYQAYHFAKAFGFKEKSLHTAIKQWEGEERRISYDKFLKEYVDMKDPDILGGKEAATQHHLDRSERAATEAADELQAAQALAGSTNEVLGAALMIVSELGEDGTRKGWNRKGSTPDEDERVICMCADNDGQFLMVGTVSKIAWGSILLWMYEDVFLNGYTKLLEAV